ncbi:MAG: response regulator [Planctomycetota bacterium]
MPDSKHVLIVDDEPDIRLGVGMWLESVGYAVSFAETGEQGLHAAQEQRPHAILLDMLMPGIDGIETLRRLRLDEATRDIPVAMLSASLRDEQRALDAGAAYFIKKPHQGRALVDAISATIDGGPRA